MHFAHRHARHVAIGTAAFAIVKLAIYAGTVGVVMVIVAASILMDSDWEVL